MSGIEDRGDAFEKKYAHDAELRFKAEARRNKLLGQWAAEKMGKSGDQVEDYAARKNMPIEQVERWLSPNLGY